MTRKSPATEESTYLGIECGGTRTVMMAWAKSSLRMEFGPANLRLMNDAQLVRHFRAIARAVPNPTALGIGMAGARTEPDRARIRRAAAKAWPGVPCYATNDLETALMAADLDRRGSSAASVLVLSGTGSCCFGRRPDGKTAKVGGWGHILGDKGSGFEIGLRALKAVVYYFDRDGEWSRLGQRILRALVLNEPDDLIGWVQRASKDEIAAVAVEVFEAWAGRDRIATDILKGAANSLARDAAACARRLVPANTEVQFILAGGVLLKQPRFASKVGRELKRLWPRAVITPLRKDGAIGAARLAEQQFPSTKPIEVIELGIPEPHRTMPGDLVSIVRSPTEQRHPCSMRLDTMPLAEAIKLMLSEDRTISKALLTERSKIEASVRLIVNSFRKGGRLFYVGAGTSGRLGVLDASECPPTFQTDPEMVQGIIAGGQRALWEAVEGAEDDANAGALAIRFRGIAPRDTVVGIAASGRTPFVWGALREAKRRGASTILLCFNPSLAIPRGDRPTLFLAPRIGPEILTGSTRLKSGTATKLVLNIFTTLAMVRLGKVSSNLMIDVKASNDKLRDRATRIVRELTGADYAGARAALEKTKWQIKAACQQLKRASSNPAQTGASCRI